MTDAEKIEALTNTFADRLRQIRAIAADLATDGVTAGRLLERVVAACDRALDPLDGVPRKMQIEFIRTGGEAEQHGVEQQDGC